MTCSQSFEVNVFMFSMAKVHNFLLLLIVENFYCLSPVVPLDQFPILPVCDFRGGLVHCSGAHDSCAARGSRARPTLRPAALCEITKMVFLRNTFQSNGDGVHADLEA